MVQTVDAHQDIISAEAVKTLVIDEYKKTFKRRKAKLESMGVYQYLAGVLKKAVSPDYLRSVVANPGELYKVDDYSSVRSNKGYLEIVITVKDSLVVLQENLYNNPSAIEWVLHYLGYDVSSRGYKKSGICSWEYIREYVIRCKLPSLPI